jgi:cytochrome b561
VPLIVYRLTIHSSAEADAGNDAAKANIGFMNERVIPPHLNIGIITLILLMNRYAIRLKSSK